ncbi:TPA: hypothetical protein MC459_000044 [Klebsiella oxytoca]|nr:hypothetical protein [Klebsiella oxytoca]
MTTDITELAQRLKEAADREMICRDVAETSEIWERTVTPENILALVETLEKAQRYIEELREWNAGLAQESCEREQRIFELENQLKAAENNEIDARCRITELEESHVQVIQSRDHHKRMSEEGLKQLAESRAVTVKLTDINEYLAEVHDKTLNRAFRLLAEGVRAGDVAAMRAAGIKVEAE